MLRWTAVWRIFVIFCYCTASTAQGAVIETIFDNTTVPAPSNYGPLLGPGLYGETIHAGGSARLVTDVMIAVSQQKVAGTSDIQLKLYANDGSGGTPGSLIWASQVIDNFATTNGATFQYVNFNVPMVQVPDTFTWMIAFSDIQGRDIGPYFTFAAPTVGTTGSRLWVGGFDPYTYSDRHLMSQISATVAVPEPSSLVLTIIFGSTIGAGLVRRHLLRASHPRMQFRREFTAN